MEINESNKNGSLLVRDSHGRVVKGSVLNPHGRPKKEFTLTDITKKILEEEMPDGVTRKELLIRKVLELAQKGNETMVKLIWSYVDGLPKQNIQHSGGIGVYSYEDILKIIRGEYVESDTDSEYKPSSE